LEDISSTSDETADIQDIRIEPSSPVRNGLNHLRQLIERGFADWRNFKERHGENAKMIY
jgi:hypothetical protein